MKNLSRRNFLKSAALGCTALGLGLTRCTSTKQPNFVIIFLDDSGWADFQPFSETTYATPHVNKLAHQGTCFHNFYVPQAICSASRASLLSGCYPGRTKVFGAHGPNDKGLDPKFATIGEIMQQHGYATGVFGKWHIGDQEETRPWNRGFAESCGLMYSNDMWEFHPENPQYWGQWPLHFWENGKVKIDRVTPTEQTQLTTWYTEHAVDFITRHKDEAFFLYVPHAMPHVPLFCSDKFKDKSGAGLYGDVMMELDWSIGQIMQALHQNGLDENTMVIMTSDNGPWSGYGNHAGKTPFREAKATSFDGGTRSACIMRYPGKISASKISQHAFCSIDILPTICQVAGAALPQNEIDGMNVWDLICDAPGAKNPHEYYAFSTGSNFEAVMSGDGKWKLHLPHNFRTLVQAGKDGQAGTYKNQKIELVLFNMENDPYETTNVLAEHPQVAERLMAFASQHKEKFYTAS